MKLSTALKKGSKGRKHIRGNFYSATGCCALGAIASGLQISTNCLADGDFMPSALQHRIVKMNDVDGASFNKIYEYLRELGL